MTVQPNFFLVGAAKSGTTALADALSQHPEVFISKVKEPYYLCHDPLVTEQDYADLFAGAGSFKIRGEATTGYLFDDSSPSLIKALDPEARVAMILRNPVDMAFSLWNFMHANGSEDRDFWAAIENTNGGPSGIPAGRRENYQYVDRALFASQVARYKHCFPAQNVEIIVYDDWRKDAQSVFRNLFVFLGVDPEFTPENRLLNSGRKTRSKLIQSLFLKRKYPLLKSIFPVVWRDRIRKATKRLNQVDGKKSSLSLEERIRLWSYFEDDVILLSKMIGREDLVDLWKPKSSRP